MSLASQVLSEAEELKFSMEEEKPSNVDSWTSRQKIQGRTRDFHRIRRWLSMTWFVLREKENMALLMSKRIRGRIEGIKGMGPIFGTFSGTTWLLVLNVPIIKDVHGSKCGLILLCFWQICTNAYCWWIWSSHWTKKSREICGTSLSKTSSTLCKVHFQIGETLIASVFEAS